MKIPRLLLLAVVVPILAITSAHAQNSYQLSGLCNGGICFTNIPGDSLDIYIDANHVPYQIGVYAAPDYHFVDNLLVAADGTFPGGSLTNVDVVTVTHRSGRFATKTVTFTATVSFDAPAGSSTPQAASTTAPSSTYAASRGYVSASNSATLDFDGGGYALVSQNLSGCSYGRSCTFSGGRVDYTLPDGSTALLANFSGSFDGVGTVSGIASGTDSNDNPVSVSVTFSFSVVCRSGRDGGCTKTFAGGSLTGTY
jgi:hypothetical protein